MKNLNEPIWQKFFGLKGIFQKPNGQFLNLISLIWRDIVDRISKRDRPNDSSDRGALAQPLKLKDSLRLRDGLGSHHVRPLQWPQTRATRLTAFDLSNLWVSNN